MCLYIDDELTEKGLKGRKVHSNGMVKVWKRLRKRNNILESPYQYSRWKPGWNKSNRNSDKLSFMEDNYGTVHRGIHVYLTRDGARRMKFSNETIVPVYVFKKDLIACGIASLNQDIKDAVFTKVFLKKEDHDKALK